MSEEDGSRGRGRSDLFFLIAAGFVIGTIIGGLGGTPLLMLALAFGSIGAAFAWFRPYLVPVSCAAVALIFGTLAYAIDDYRYHAKGQALRGETNFEGTVIRVPREREEGQSALVRLEEGAGRVMLYTEGHSALAYGDIVRFSGELVPPPQDSFGRFLAKEHVLGSVFRPEVDVIGRGGNVLMRSLIALRNRIDSAVHDAFPREQAAFLAGVLLGDRDAFTEGFLDKLSISGTMHLVALSGQHMVFIVFAMSILFGTLLRRRPRLAFTASFAMVAIFVAMTGFAVSAVRAALMSFLVAFAKESGRLYSPHNALAFSAFIISLFNPKTAAFDLGFQLSFAATAAIIYLAPVVLQIPFFSRPGFAGWRVILAITLAAQAGVFPLTVANFANFSFTSLLANIAILVTTPALMLLGYLGALALILIPPLGALFVPPVSFLLAYSIGVVEIGAAIAVPFNPAFNLWGAAAYYALLGWICWHWRMR